MEVTEHQNTPEVVQLELIPTIDGTESPVPYTLLFINRAYSRREISFDEWLKLTKEWAERMIEQHSKTE